MFTRDVSLDFLSTMKAMTDQANPVARMGHIVNVVICPPKYSHQKKKTSRSEPQVMLPLDYVKSGPNMSYVSQMLLKFHR